MNVKQACKMRKWQGQTLSMSEEWILVCTHSCANSCKEVRVCDYEYWIKWAWLFEPAQSKTEGSGGYSVSNLMPGSVDISVCSRIVTNKTPSLSRIEILEKSNANSKSVRYKLAQWRNRNSETCQCLKMEILSVHTAVLIHAKSSGLWLRVLN